MLEIEEDLVLLSHMVRPIVDRGAVCSRSLHHDDHYSGDIYLVTSRKGPPVSCLVVSASLDSCGVLIFFLLKNAVTRFCTAPTLLFTGS